MMKIIKKNITNNKQWRYTLQFSFLKTRLLHLSPVVSRMSDGCQELLLDRSLFKDSSTFTWNLWLDSQNGEYYKILTLFVMIFIISLLLFSVAYFISLSTLKDREKLSQYECGFEPFDEATRHPFDVHFYVVGILFLIFDVEIALLFPWVLGLKETSWLSFFTMLIFLFILTLGFFYEWHRGALVWPHEQELKHRIEEESRFKSFTPFERKQW